AERLYVAIGEPGVVTVVDTRRLSLVEAVPTEEGAHTIAWDADQRTLYAFLPRSCAVAVLVEREGKPTEAPPRQFVLAARQSRPRPQYRRGGLTLDPHVHHPAPLEVGTNRQ